MPSGEPSSTTSTSTSGCARAQPLEERARGCRLVVGRHHHHAPGMPRNLVDRSRPADGRAGGASTPSDRGRPDWMPGSPALSTGLCCSPRVLPSSPRCPTRQVRPVESILARWPSIASAGRATDVLPGVTHGPLRGGTRCVNTWLTSELPRNRRSDRGPGCEHQVTKLEDRRRVALDTPGVVCTGFRNLSVPRNHDGAGGGRRQRSARRASWPPTPIRQPRHRGPRRAARRPSRASGSRPG